MHSLIAVWIPLKGILGLAKRRNNRDRSSTCWKLPPSEWMKLQLVRFMLQFQMFLVLLYYFWPFPDLWRNTLAWSCSKIFPHCVSLSLFFFKSINKVFMKPHIFIKCHKDSDCGFQIKTHSLVFFFSFTVTAHPRLHALSLPLPSHTGFLPANRAATQLIFQMGKRKREHKGVCG